MLRRTACGLLLCATVALAASCSDTSTGTTPTPTPITEPFTGTVSPASGDTHSFVTLTGGPITARLDAVGPDSTKSVGFSIGTFNATLNTCTAVVDNPAALQSFVFNVTASSLGVYCVRVYDNGNTTTDAIPYTYSVTVVHPQ